jgi:excinuclease UvrABC ATPase subunit
MTRAERNHRVSAWGKPHEIAEGACSECQGSCFVPADAVDTDRLVRPCEACAGTGKSTKRKAA